MTGTIVIKATDRGELYEFAVLLDSCWRSAYRGILSDDFLAAMDVRDRHKGLQKGFDEGNRHFVSMRDNGVLIGAGVCGKSYTEGYPNDGEVSAIYLRSDYIGKGHGSALLTHMENLLMRDGYRNLVLDVFSDNKRAIEFYAKNSYKTVRECKLPFGDNAYAVSIMRKILKQ